MFSRFRARTRLLMFCCNCLERWFSAAPSWPISSSRLSSARTLKLPLAIAAEARVIVRIGLAILREMKYAGTTIKPDATSELNISARMKLINELYTSTDGRVKRIAPVTRCILSTIGTPTTTPSTERHLVEINCSPLLTTCAPYSRIVWLMRTSTALLSAVYAINFAFSSKI